MSRVYVAGHRLPNAEASILQTLLDEGPLLVSELRDRLPGRTKANTTILTLLSRLSDRGLVVREPAGRGHRYRPAGTEQELAVMALEQSLQGVDGPAEAVLAFIDRLPPATRRKLHRGLRQSDGPT